MAEYTADASWSLELPSDTEYEYDTDIAEPEVVRPKVDMHKTWCWVFKIDSQPDSYEYLHQQDKCKTVIGVIEEGERYGLHIGGLSCYTNNSRKPGAAATALSLCESIGFTGSIKYCEPPIEQDSGRNWFIHNCKSDSALIASIRADARARGWTLYWTRADKKSVQSTEDELHQSGNMEVISRWFNKYRSERGDNIPSYADFRFDVAVRFGGAVANMERNLRLLYDTWEPSRKRTWLADALDALPDDDPLVKQSRREIDHEECARMMSKWADSWMIFSEQRDYQMKDVDHQRCMRLYCVMMMLICRTSGRHNGIKWHGLWIVGKAGMGKTMLSRFVAGPYTRSKKVNGDSKGVGRFNMNRMMEVLIIDDVKTVSYESMDFYAVVNQILDNAGTEVKIFGSTTEVKNKYLIITSNDRIQQLEDEQTHKEDDNSARREAHPLRRRVLEIRMSEFAPFDLCGPIWSIYENASKTEDGDRIMWTWYRLESSRHRFVDGCRDKRLVALQSMMDEQCRKYFD